MFLQLFHSFYTLGKTIQNIAKNNRPKRESVDSRELLIYIHFGEGSSWGEFSRSKVGVYPE